MDGRSFCSPYLEFVRMISLLFLIFLIVVQISKKENPTGRYRNMKKIHVLTIEQINTNSCKNVHSPRIRAGDSRKNKVT